jgi:hypothetical protein
MAARFGGLHVILLRRSVKTGSPADTRFAWQMEAREINRENRLPEEPLGGLL